MVFVRTTPPRPAEEPWPHCEGSHLHHPADVRLKRRIRARLHRDPRGPAFTLEEAAIKRRNAAMLKKRFDAGTPPAECSVPMLPVAQL